jgi:hypothetical protein
MQRAQMCGFLPRRRVADRLDHATVAALEGRIAELAPRSARHQAEQAPPRALRQRGPETTAGEGLRYLAELPLVPHAIAHNRELEWRELDERTAEVAARIGGQRLTIELEFNDEGDIVRSSSHDRRRKVVNEWLPAPWGGQFGDDKTLGGIRLPTSGDAYWELPGCRYVYWRGTILSAQLLNEPFGRSA